MQMSVPMAKPPSLHCKKITDNCAGPKLLRVLHPLPKLLTCEISLAPPHYIFNSCLRNIGGRYRPKTLETQSQDKHQQ